MELLCKALNTNTLFFSDKDFSFRSSVAGYVHLPCLSSEWHLCKYVIVNTKLPPSPVILWIELGGKPKWLPLNFGYHDVMHTGSILGRLLTSGKIDIWQNEPASIESNTKISVCAEFQNSAERMDKVAKSPIEFVYP